MKRFGVVAGVILIMLIFACGSGSNQDTTGDNELQPTTLIVSAGSSTMNGKYLNISGTRASGPDCGGGGDYFGETLSSSEAVIDCGLLASDGVSDGMVSSSKQLCPGTWDFSSISVYDDSSCTLAAPEVDYCDDASSVSIAFGSNTVSIDCYLAAADVTFDVKLQSEGE